MVASLEDLQRHSRDYKRANPLLLRLYGEAFEYPKLTEFENARVAVQGLQRYESGLRKQLGLIRKKSVIQELRARRQSRHTFRNLTATRIVGPEATMRLSSTKGMAKPSGHLSRKICVNGTM